MELKVEGLKFKVRSRYATLYFTLKSGVKGLKSEHVRNFVFYTFYFELKIYICIVKQRQWCSAYLNRCKADDAYPNKLFIYLHVGYV
ncbi:MAG: hypothetical protein JWR05_2915 [Mucilaginibacter sp.]|nr:hypothetical protein [Mucilaginibacter sp.]